MVTLLDCINRVPELTEAILDHYEQHFEALLQSGSVALLQEIILVGSGTSNTSAVTARSFIEKTSGLRTSCLLPNEFLYETAVLNPMALIVVVSQSGTSALTQDAVKKARKNGNLTVAITENDQTPIARDADVSIEMGCGKEEYGMRTIGYCTSVLTLMLMGMAIGKKRGFLSVEKEAALLSQAAEVPASHRQMSQAAMQWFDQNKESLMNADSFTLYGGGPLWGVALEGALKILEISKRKMAVGYEIDDGMHGPTMGFTNTNCVLALDDGGVNQEKCRQLIQWAKQEKHNGFLIGPNGLDETDLFWMPKCDEFRALEIAPAVQILAYRLAVDAGIDLSDRSIHKESQYFKTHRDA